MATGVNSFQLHFHTIILSKLTGNIGVCMEHKNLIILIFSSITTHINLPLCVSPTPWLTPKIRKEEKSLPWDHRKRAVYSGDSDFPYSPFDSILSTVDYDSDRSINEGIPETLNISEAIKIFETGNFSESVPSRIKYFPVVFTCGGGLYIRMGVER